MGKVAVISIAVLYVVTVNADSYDFVTPPNCDPYTTFDDTFLLNSLTVKTRGMCARECARNARCASLTTVGDHPNVECKLYEQVTNRMGLYASPAPDSVYLEKKRDVASTGKYRSWACNIESRDVGGGCDKRDSRMRAGDILLREEYLCSSNLRYRAKMQGDGNFVVYDMASATPSPVWATGTEHQPCHRARLLESGEFVLEDVDGNQLYSTGNTGALNILKLANDGTIKIQSQSKTEIWTSG